ncbi:MAG: anthranilate synthase component I [Fimbriimonadaceae bacterium]|nr:anthranilate synthase component I [Fimbriimonadaceae bacterium]QYK59404.1 MAG: anthranilate synthase component I [Fimbriimonadaceae bacterium]
MLHPDLDTLLRLAEIGGRVPVWRETLADVETPLSAYWKLAQNEPLSFLLESVTGGENLARYSVIGVRPRQVLRSELDHCRVSAPGADDIQILGDPIDWIAAHLPRLAPGSGADMPKFGGGWVGMIGYDYAKLIEQLPEGPPDSIGTPTVALMLAESVVVFDHARNTIRFIVLAEGSSASYREAEREIDRLEALVRNPLPPLPRESHPAGTVTANTTRQDFEASVRRAVDYIAAGDCIQVVPSLRFSTQVQAHPVTVYRALRSINPSPYMFLFRFGDFDIVGASPELLVSQTGRTARVRPIAGTRHRGRDQAEDNRLASELLADEKERAEHLMLVDLGRNDLGRVCEYGSVEVDDFMTVERYSHVMHIVSSVRGTLREGVGPAELVRSCFPAGTVSGAPKVRAMEIISELEPSSRGPYAGAIGYFSAQGDLDLAIAIRTIVMKDGVAHVQAGAGIVFDSDPGREYEECANKARASLRAIELAQGGLRSVV